MKYSVLTSIYAPDQNLHTSAASWTQEKTSKAYQKGKYHKVERRTSFSFERKEKEISDVTFCYDVVTLVSACNMKNYSRHGMNHPIALCKTMVTARAIFLHPHVVTHAV